MRASPLALGILVACAPATQPPETSAPAPQVTSASPDAVGSRVLIAAGDIACAPLEAVTPTTCHQAGTARVVGRTDPFAVLLLGDVQYESGAPWEYRSFDRTWGQAIDRSGTAVLPVTGNHEYGSVGPPSAGCRLVWAGHEACGFERYFARRTRLLRDGDAQYAVTFGSAQPHPLTVIVLDVGACDWDTSRCGSDGPVVGFLRRALADPNVNPPAGCTIVAWHQARWSEVGHGDLAWVDPVWRALFSVPSAARPDLVLNGHDHVYERFRPLGAGGVPDPEGIPEIVAGAGGREIARVPGWIVGGSDRLATIDPARFGVLELGWSPSTPELVTRFLGEDGTGRDRAVHPCNG